MKRFGMLAGLLVAIFMALTGSISPASAGTSPFSLAGPPADAVNTPMTLTVTYSSQTFPTPVKIVDVTATPFDVASGQSTVANTSGSLNFSVTPTFAGNRSYQAWSDFGGDSSPLSNTIIVNVTAAAAAQTITFPPPADTLVSAGPVTLTATASSGLAVSYATNSAAVCTVSGSTAVLVAPGVCSITASQPGNAGFAAATPVTRTFNVTQNPNAITFPKPADTLVSAGPVTLAATASSGLAVSYATNSAAVCTVAGSTAVLVAPGVCSITASQPGNAGFVAATPVTQTFNVTQNPNAITFPKPADTLLSAGPVALTATASSGLAVSYATNSAAVCTVSGSTAVLVAPGVCSITASQPGNASFVAATPVTQTFNVTANPNTITFPKPADTLVSAGPVTLTATASSGLTVSYATNSAAICTIAGNTAVLVAPGVCSITASQPGNASFVAATPVTQTFTVTQTANAITFPKPADTLVSAGPVTLAATASSGLAVSYASNSAAVCTVAGGTAVLVAPGLCSITASQPGGPGIAAATPVTQTFNVTLNPNAITFPKPADLLLTAGPAALAATASSGLAVAYASNAPAVCTVSGATAVLVAAGTCSITATQPGNASFAAATPVTQTFAVRPVAAAPVALSFSVDVPYLSPGQAIDLAPHVTGSFTSLALASASASGTVALAASVATYKPGRGFSGGDRFTYTATGPGGTSAPATVTITVGNRPDPSLDPDVKGIVNAEVAAMTRFGSAQDDNINRRLETIHDDNVDAVSIGTGIAVNEALPAGAQALTEIKHNDPASAGAKSALALKSAFPEKPAARGVKYVESPFYFWTGGSILFGRTSVNGTTDNRFATSGVTAGVDAKFIDGFKAGLAAGFANDRTRVGVNGSRTSATFYSASAYASYRLLPKTFLDATLGYGTATFDTRRFITQEQVFATGKRNGHEVFGSLTLTREETWEGVKIATYGRLYAAQVTLDRSTEAGSNIFALAYGKLSQTSFAGTLGLRALYPIAMDWGKLTPMARLEYRHAFDNAYKQGLVYADQPAGQSYTVSGLGSTRDLFSGALGLQAEVGGNVKANLEYQLYLSAQKVQAQGLRGIVVIGF